MKGECAMSLVLEFVSCVVKNLVNVPEDVMDGWVQNPKALQDALTNALCPSKKEPELLRLITSAGITGAKKFVAKDHLAVANVGWTGGNLKKLFLDKVEENVADTIVTVYRLEQSSLDAPIMAKLGERTVIKLAYFFELLKRQSKGEDGVLLTNGYANVAYIEGNDGNIWAVYASWYSEYHYWFVEAYSVENPRRWYVGDQILSRDS